ncbi:MAG TPA: hypothetical protein VHF26_16940, partial [Trebonia sp.]|nr:hypothetical protein [Trebonia sp.]
MNPATDTGASAVPSASAPPSGAASAAVRALARRYEQHVDELVRRMVDQWAAELPEARLLPDDLRDAERANTSRESIRAFLRMLQGEPADEASREQFRRRAAERAAEGVPLPVLLRTYTIGARVLFEALRQEARSDEAAALTDIAQVLLAGQDEVIADVARAYRDELAALGSARRD